MILCLFVYIIMFFFSTLVIIFSNFHCCMCVCHVLIKSYLLTYLLNIQAAAQDIPVRAVVFVIIRDIPAILL